MRPSVSSGPRLAPSTAQDVFPRSPGRPTSKLVAPPSAPPYALTGSLETDSDHGDLAGVHITLSDGGADTVRERRAAALLDTGFFYGASRFRLIEGRPDPPRMARGLGDRSAGPVDRVRASLRCRRAPTRG